jgi:NAD(P)-dependent dehydrogenase (short-subunit alcohol dehydrogenase family)
LGGTATAAVLDLADPTSIAGLPVDRLDILVNNAAGHHRSEAHAAFYAAKHAKSGYAEILCARLRPEGIRVISLYPPDFVQDGPRDANSTLTAQSVVDCVLFAVHQPRDCFIRAFYFEQLVPRR